MRVVNVEHLKHWLYGRYMDNPKEFKELCQLIDKKCDVVETNERALIDELEKYQKAIEDIKAEIESYVSEEPHQLMSKTTVLEIIDKYRKEQE